MRGSSQALGGMPKARSIWTASANDGDLRPDKTSDAWLTLTFTVRATSVGRRDAMVLEGDFMPLNSHGANIGSSLQSDPLMEKFACRPKPCGS